MKNERTDEERTEEELSGFSQRRSDRKKSLPGSIASSIKDHGGTRLPKSATSWLVAVAILTFTYRQFSDFNKIIEELAKRSVETELGIIKRDIETLNQKVNQCHMDQKKMENKLTRKIGEAQAVADNWWSVREPMPEK